MEADCLGDRSGRRVCDLGAKDGCRDRVRRGLATPRRNGCAATGCASPSSIYRAPMMIRPRRDVTDRAQVDAAISAIREALGPILVLVNAPDGKASRGFRICRSGLVR